MSHLDPEAIDRAFALLGDAIQARPRLRQELLASRGEFFRKSFDEGPPRDLSWRRHLEWFAIERESPSLGSTPIECAMEDESFGLDRALAQTLHTSHASIFEVTAVDPGVGVWLRDLAGLGEYPALEPAAWAVLSPGDLIAGRIFVVGDSIVQISKAAGFWRSERLREAVRRDLERSRASRRASLRLSQAEIEDMFFGPEAVDSSAATAGPERPVEEARSLLQEAGLAAHEADSILAELSAAPLDATRLLPGAGDALGGILDRLAFASAVDLDRVRRALLAAWTDLRSEAPGEASARGPDQPARGTDVERAIAEFDCKRRLGLPLERIFQELERDLDLPGQTAPSDDENDPAPDFPGVVGAMIEEFLWELDGQGQVSRVAGAERLRSLGRFASGIGVFENLRASDILEYLCRWIPESGELESAHAAEELVLALGRFCTWASEVHDLSLAGGLADRLKTIGPSLARVVEVNSRCSAPPSADRGDVFHCLALPVVGPAQVEDHAGHVHFVRLAPDVREWLRHGDPLRGSLSADGVLSISCCYPPEGRETGIP